MRFFWVLWALIAIAASAPGAVFTNSVSVDTFVRADAPALNYGEGGALSVSGPNAMNGRGVNNGVFDSFIRFNTAALVTGFNSMFGTSNWVISRAKLRVTELGAPANALFNRGIGAFEIRWITNDVINGLIWVEGTGTPNAPTTIGISYNDEPALLSRGLDASLGTFTNAGVDTTLSFPLTLAAGFVNDVRAGGEVGLYLTAVDPGIGFTVDSRSFGIANARPFLEISAVPRPGVARISVSAPGVVLAATNGAAGGTYCLLTSTNMAAPLNQWLPIGTNLLTVNGDFTVTVTNGMDVKTQGRQFFMLQTR
jgi:hypothetical protein